MNYPVFIGLAPHSLPHSLFVVVLISNTAYPDVESSSTLASSSVLDDRHRSSSKTFCGVQVLPCDPDGPAIGSLSSELSETYMNHTHKSSRLYHIHSSIFHSLFKVGKLIHFHISIIKGLGYKELNLGT